MSTPQVEAFLEMMAVERDASPHTLSAYGRDLADAEAATGGLMAADMEALEGWYAGLGRRGLSWRGYGHRRGQRRHDRRRRGDLQLAAVDHLDTRRHGRAGAEIGHALTHLMHHQQVHRDDGQHRRHAHAQMASTGQRAGPRGGFNRKRRHRRLAAQPPTHARRKACAARGAFASASSDTLPGTSAGAGPSSDKVSSR